MTATATPVLDAVSLCRVDHMGDITALAIPNPSNDYHGYKQAPVALLYEGRVHGRSCYDSDRGIIIYRSDVSIARSVR